MAVASCADEATPRRARNPRLDAPGAPRPRVRWDHVDALLSLRIAREAMRSSHFVGEPEATIRANEIAARYGRPGPPLPGGSLIVVTHERQEGIVHFAMARPAAPAGQPARWDYAVIDAAGWVVESGRIPLCVRCHEEAPGDELFGPGATLDPP